MFKFVNVCVAAFTLCWADSLFVQAQSMVVVLPSGNRDGQSTSDNSVTSTLPVQEKPAASDEAAKPQDKLATIEQTLDAISKNLTITTGIPILRWSWAVSSTSISSFQPPGRSHPARRSF